MIASSPDLIALFDSLPTPSNSPADGVLFSVLPIEGCGHLCIGKDRTSNPALLVLTQQSPQNPPLAPIILEHMTVQHSVECRLIKADGPATQHFSVVRCIADDPLLQQYFLRVLSPVIRGLPELPTQRDIVDTVAALVELFRALSAPPRKPLQGLWAELFLIMQASDPAILIAAWHNEPEERYDFAYDSQRVEVKSTSKRVRAHHFSLEQLKSPAGVEVVVASIFAEQSPAGLTIYDLVHQIRTKVQNAALLALLDRKVAEVLGSGWREAALFKCDVSLAIDSVRYFDAGIIPAITEPTPPSVSDIRFTSDLTAVPSVDILHMSSRGRLFAAAVGPV